MNQKRKIAGCCTLCDKELVDVLSRWVEGHPYAGEPRDIGKWHDGAMRLDFVLSGGSTTTLTFCEDCAGEAESRLPEIWRKCLAGLAFEVEHYVAIGHPPMEDVHRRNVDASNMKLAGEIPLGVTSRQKWRDQVDARST